MDLGEAIDLARSGISQAAAELGSDGRQPGGPPRADVRPSAGRGVSDEAVPLLERGDFDAWVEDVARELVEIASGRHWYDLDAAGRARWLKLAKAAILAVEAVPLRRTQRRLRDRYGYRPEPLTDLEEREACAGLGRGRFKAA